MVKICNYPYKLKTRQRVTSLEMKALLVITYLNDIRHYEPLKMNKPSDEHTHHPGCEACGKEFDNVHELTVHVDRASTQILVNTKACYLFLSSSKTISCN